MKRHFHAVGQGAFYSESFESYSAVYDCGSSVPARTIERDIRRALSAISPVEILFLSHLHTDHVNLVEILLQVRRPKHVVLPLLSKAERIELTIRNAITSKLNRFTEQAIWNPTEAFGEAAVTLVRPATGDYPPAEDSPIFELGALPAAISSGAKIRYDKRTKWVFVPFNFQSDRRSSILDSLLSQADIQINNADEFNAIWNDPSRRKKLMMIYKKLPGNQNTNSMTLYSGPEGINHYWDDHYFRHFWDHFWMDWPFYCGWDQTSLRHSLSSLPRRIRSVLRLFWPAPINYRYRGGFPLAHLAHFRPGCLYLGDYEAKGRQMYMQLARSYKWYWPYIGFVQIPHHGSWYNYNVEINRHSPLVSVISAGRFNKYGHPHRKTLFCIISNGGLPVVVDERRRTEAAFHIPGI